MYISFTFAFVSICAPRSARIFTALEIDFLSDSQTYCMNDFSRFPSYRRIKERVVYIEEFPPTTFSPPSLSPLPLRLSPPSPPSSSLPGLPSLHPAPPLLPKKLLPAHEHPASPMLTVSALLHYPGEEPIIILLKRLFFIGAFMFICFPSCPGS